MLVSFLAEVCAIYLLEFCLILKYFIFDFIVPVFGLISVKSDFGMRYCLENSKGAERVKSSAYINCQAAPDGCHPHCRGIRLFYFGIQYIIMSLVLILSPYP